MTPPPPGALNIDKLMKKQVYKIGDYVVPVQIPHNDQLWVADSDWAHRYRQTLGCVGKVRNNDYEEDRPLDVASRYYTDGYEYFNHEDLRPALPEEILEYKLTL